MENKQTDPQQESNERAERRKKRRKKERLQAMAIVGGALLIVLLIVVGIISAIVHAVTSKKHGNGDGGNTDSQIVMQDESDDKDEETVTDDTDALSEDESGDETQSADSGDTDSRESADTALEEGSDTAEGEAGAIEGETAVAEGEEGAIEGEAGAIIGDGETDPGNDGTDAAGADKTEDTVTSVKDSDMLSSLQLNDMTAHDDEIKKEIAELTLEQKIAKLFIVTPGQLIGTEIEPTNVGSKFGEKLASYPVSGILLKKQNLKSEDELKSMVSNIRLMCPGNLFLVAEDAGGQESPFVSSGITENVVASQKEIGESLGSAGAYSAGISIGSQLRHFEFTVDLAPTADVSKSPSSYAASHGFGTDMET
ncbi:MAG: hypothetical protein IK078_03200, partial [Lachnospiraceae bacterium]|nr:hypothetical protein [Lachnospiraceae bacterium]